MKAGLFTYKDDESLFGPTDKLRSIVRDGTGGFTGCVNNGQQKAAISPATRHFNNTAGTTGKSTPKKNNNNNDGLLGGLLLQCLIGVPMLDAFSHAANMPVALEPAEICHAVEFADEIMTDRAKPRPPANADFKICEGGKLGSAFNMRRLPAQPKVQIAPENDNDAQIRQLVAANGQGSHAVALRLKP